MNDRPLISFYVIACNQERFVAEAVAGALAQTWSPLEVVLSDDCSNDRTFDVMRDMAQAYKGPHKVVLNRNAKRLGVGAHINSIVRICTGDWIVASAGDDVSLPQRTAKLRADWEADGERAGLVYSNLVETREDGTDWYTSDFRKEVPGSDLRWDYNLRLHGRCPPVHGATFAYPRRIHDDFGPLWKGIVFEDHVLNWRAELSGGILLCPEPLVRHRNHEGQITNVHSAESLLDADNRRRALRWSNVVTRRQNLADARIAFEHGRLDAETYRDAERILTQRLRPDELDYELFWGSFARRWQFLLSSRAARGKRLSQILFAALPRPLYLFALRVIARRTSQS